MRNGISIRGVESRPVCSSRGRSRSRAALLLEVVIALSILAATTGLLGAELVNGLRMTGYAETQMRANQLGERVLALLDLDPNSTQAFFESRQAQGDFGNAFPGWFWKATVDLVPNVNGIGLVTVQLLHQPDVHLQKDMGSAKVVRQLHEVKANPGRIDLVTDFGMSQEQIDQLLASVPIAGLNPAALDPQALVAMDAQTLMQLLPQLLPLLQQFGGGALTSGTLAGMLGGGGNQQAIADLLRSRLSGKVDDATLNALLAGLGSGAGGSGSVGGLAGAPRGPAGPAPGSTPPPGPNRDLSNNFLRDFIKQQLGGQLSDEQIDQLFSGGGSGGGALNPPPASGNPSGQGQTIQQIHNNRGGGGTVAPTRIGKPTG